MLCACGGVPPVGGAAGGAGGTGGGGTAVVSPPDTPCAFVATPPTPTSNPSCPQGTYTGNVTIDGPEDIAALSGCTRIAGDLNVAGPTLTSIRGLEALRVVEGKISLVVGGLPCPDPRYCIGIPQSPLLTSLRGLDELRCVGGDMGLLTASPPLVDASGLGKLSDVEGSLQVYSYGLLAHPLPALTRVYGDVTVPGPNAVPALTTVYGGIGTFAGPAEPAQFPRLSYVGCGAGYPPCRDGVLGCDFSASGQSAVEPLSACKFALKSVSLSGADLTNSAPLRQLRHVPGLLTIQGTGLTDLSGLTDLERAGGLLITDNAALRSVSGLDGVTVGYADTLFPPIPDDSDAFLDTGGIKIKSNATLASLSWPNVRLAGPPGNMGVQLVDNPELTSFGNWPWLTEIFRLAIAGSPLTSLAGLQALETADTVTLSDLPNLTSLAGLDNLESVSTFEVFRAGISNVDALSKLTEVVESLGIASCPSLTSVTGLRSLTGATGQLYLIGVPALTSLRGLEALSGTQTLSISSAGISNLTGLTNLASAYSISIDSCPRLTSLSGLSGLTQLDVLNLAHLPVFTSLAGPPAASSIASLTIEDLPALASLTGFNASTDMNELRLHRVPVLQNLLGLDRAVRITTLDIDDAGSLKTLDGLGALEEVGQRFHLSRTALGSLRALTNLRYVNNGPGISNNPLLSDCELRWLFERVGYTLPVEDVSNAGPRNCTLTGPVTTPGLVWSRFVERSNGGLSAMHLMPDNRLAIVGGVTEPIFTPPPGAPQTPRPPAGTSAATLRLSSPTGDPLSVRLLGDFSGESQDMRCSSTDALGRITIVVNEHSPDRADQTAVFRFASDGSLLSERRQPALPEDDCAIDDAGNVYLAARRLRILKKQDAAGNLVWEKSIEVPAGLGADTYTYLDNSASGVLLQVFAAAPDTTVALLRFSDDGRQAWTRLLTASLSDRVRMVMAPDAQVTVLGVARSSVSTDGSGTSLPFPNGIESFGFLLRLRSDGSVASLRALPEPMRSGQVALGAGGSVYVVNDGYGYPNDNPAAALYKFDISGNLLFKRDLGPLLAGWTGSGQFTSIALRASSERVVLAALAPYTDAFLAQLTP